MAKQISADVWCVYGALTASHRDELFLMLMDWLSVLETRYLLLVEVENILCFHPLLAHPQVRLVLARDDEFKQVAWEFVFLQWDYLNASQDELGDRVLAQVAQIQLGVHLTASDYSDRGKQVLSNVFANLFHLRNSRKAQDMFGAFQKTPAIICGAGPSLAKNVHSLARLEERGLLFAGGSALNVLSPLGIVPHFCASIDPNPPYDRFSSHALFEVPFLYQSRVSRQLLALVHAPLMWMTGSGGYPLEMGINAELGLGNGVFDGGWNVATFCLALSYHMGADPIVLVGMDLCGKEQENLYGPGVSRSADGGSGLIETQDSDGQIVYAKRDWLMAKQWMESFMESHPDRTYINATEGGLGFKHARSLTLEETVDKYLVIQEDMRGRVHAVLQELNLLNVMPDDCLGKVEKSFYACEQQCIHMLQAMETHYPAFPEAVLTGMEEALKEETVYTQLLLPLWHVWKHVILRQTETELSHAHVVCLHRLLFFKEIVGIGYEALRH